MQSHLSEEDIARIVEDTMLKANHIESLYAAVQRISDSMNDIRWCVKLGPFTSVLLIWVPNSDALPSLLH
ncbi:hypothetical protein SCLCIDRAFT_1214459 [Scleroderma citrinum Foug A]|uniref:Uncharacterized protein n=1 Tax=Scleroderma citrinum Foug A TaxID=1036808 RepID=A0A0C3E568_9AGAM|nr:hypothetical protein SCLCIDRAFT_1214459 [Scleroderma citrinum Foug A]